MAGFDKIGSRYIADTGDDSNSGTDIAPKRSFIKYSGTVVCGTARHKGAFNFTANTDSTYIADGIVILDCTANFLIGTVNGQLKLILGEDSADAGMFILNMNGFTIGHYFFQNTLGIGDRLHSVGINNGAHNFRVGYAYTIKRGFHKNCTIAASASRLYIYAHKILGTIANIALENSSLIDCLIAEGSTLVSSVYFSNPANQFKNCCVNGIITIGGVDYEVKQDENGDFFEEYPAALDISTIDPTVYSRNIFNADPLLLNDEFHLHVNQTSPLLGRGLTVQSIADVNIATEFDAYDFQSPDSLQDIIVSATGLSFDPASVNNYGWVRLPPKKISETPSILGAFLPIGALDFNSAEAIGDALNNNALQVENPATGVLSLPKRLTFKIRTSLNNTQPSVDSDYDNSGLLTAGEFAYVRYFIDPTVDSNGLGNAEELYDKASRESFAMRWVQVEIYLQKGR